MSNIVASPVRSSLPEALKASMALYRLDLAPLPEGYIEWQVKLAQTERERLEEAYRLTVHAEAMVNSGWADGMRELQLVVETRSGKLLKLRWCDSNQGFLVDTGHGQTALFPADLG